MTGVYDFEALATYNAEVARGIVHTPEWVEKMRHEQDRFDTPAHVRAEQDERLGIREKGTE